MASQPHWAPGIFAGDRTEDLWVQQRELSLALLPAAVLVGKEF